MLQGESMKDWKGSRNSVYVTNGDSNHCDYERASYDYYATDPRAVERLLEREKFDEYILEPACGGGHISKVLDKHGYVVTSSDIVRRDYESQDYTADFFKDNIAWGGDIITNPPYSMAKEFVEHSLEIIEEGHKVAMFLKLTFLEGEKRRKLFAENPPKKIYIFVNRINCALNGIESEFSKSSAVCYAWYIWEKGFKGKPVVDWI